MLAMAELALVSANRTKMETLSKSSTGAAVALELMNDPGSFLSTIQIGITIIGIFSGAYSGQNFAEPLGDWLDSYALFHGYGYATAFTLVVVLITYISIVLGELIPKRMAMTKPEKIAVLISRPIRVFSKISHPFVVVLNLSSKFILKLLNQKEVKETSVTEEEIHSVMQQGLEEGTIDDFEHKVFRKVLQFGDLEARVIMTPRIKLTYLDLADSVAENTSKILQNPHRYYPVFEDGPDNFIGILDTKDAFTQLIEGKPLDFRLLIKEAPCVIEDNLGPDLLEQFKKFKTHIAIVVDEYGSMQGIVTLVDLIETLVGTVPESHQDRHYEIIERPDGSWLCDGLTPIDDIEELLQASIVEAFDESEFNTLGGFLLVNFKYIPKEGETIAWQQFEFEIVDMDGSRIDKVLIKKTPSNQ